MTIPILFKPIKAINAPIPALIARLKSAGTLCIIQTRNFVNERIRNKIPEINTTPSAVCQGTFIPKTSPKVKYALSPIPTLIAIGVFAQSPLSTVEKIVINAVAVMSASMGIPVLLIIIALTGTMYIMVKKVVKPAVISVLTVVPFFSSLKNPTIFSLIGFDFVV